MLQADIVVIGGGIMGLSIARELSKRYPGASLIVIEKEPAVALHASGRNSGVLHAGFYYTADSLKARFTRAGNRALTDYCLENGLPINRCGKVVVASCEQEVDGILELKRRGDRNGVELALVDPHELNAIEPNARTVETALFSPTTATVDPQQVCAHLASRFPRSVRVLLGRRVIGRSRDGVRTDRERIDCRYVFNAAGLYADRVAREFGAGDGYTMIPFKGIYLRYRDDGLLRRHVYPVPNLRNPFLGVHFTKTVDGHVKIGPTAIPAFWRETATFPAPLRCPRIRRDRGPGGVPLPDRPVSLPAPGPRGDAQVPAGVLHPRGPHAVEAHGPGAFRGLHPAGHPGLSCST